MTAVRNKHGLKPVLTEVIKDYWNLYFLFLAFDTSEINTFKTQNNRCKVWKVHPSIFCTTYHTQGPWELWVEGCQLNLGCQLNRTQTHFSQFSDAFQIVTQGLGLGRNPECLKETREAHQEHANFIHRGQRWEINFQPWRYKTNMLTSKPHILRQETIQSLSG